MGGDAEVILLDAHVLIWLASEPAKLSKKAGDAIRRASQETGIAISAITLWELAWLATHNRLEITGTVEAFVEKISSRTAIRPITVQIAVLANQLPADYAGDPCDRLIGATALVEGMALVTKDTRISAYKQIKSYLVSPDQELSAPHFFRPDFVGPVLTQCEI